MCVCVCCLLCVCVVCVFIVCGRLLCIHRVAVCVIAWGYMFMHMRLYVRAYVYMGSGVSLHKFAHFATRFWW